MITPFRLTNDWRKAAACNDSGCVEARVYYGRVQVRDSKNPDGPTLDFTHNEWRVFLLDVIRRRSV
ncbi:MAG TPA: DUF397 domain-containing protein [Streptosporangiaceae bacterium]